ncbi:ABC transporter substrate-binding protein [Streptomyces sp. SID3343]|uniref:ABC transporter substrate-binding protein n=1 Tax=Streptomyces sp. SID3343 TaxID=2690260 RepID=UPI001371D6C5|nr:ABC transporter substrate-binding protein [Streptomyces sp. SID3343]MYV98933.1 ABC transporter substrate-binding protein [Streptomyces sp. SID3343]
MTTVTGARPDELWFTRCPVPTATGIAADLGLLAAEFADEGITVRSLQDVPADVAGDHHYTHALPGLFREGGNVPALWARARGEATRLVGLTWIEESQAILVRADSGVDTPERLRGLRLAVPRHDIAIDFWRAMALHGFAGALSLAGAELSDARLVDVPATRESGQWEAELAALGRGDVDAVYVKGALAVETAARHGAVVGVDLDAVADARVRVNNGTPRPITVHQDLLDHHPDLVTRFLAVLVGAAEWAAGHPADVARILGAETGAGAVGVAGAYREFGPSTLRIDLSDERLDLLARQERFLRGQGFLAAPVDVRAWAAREPLDDARALAARRPPTSRAPHPRDLELPSTATLEASHD